MFMITALVIYFKNLYCVKSTVHCEVGEIIYRELKSPLGSPCDRNQSLENNKLKAFTVVKSLVSSELSLLLKIVHHNPMTEFWFN